jgi:hypothetical protein
MAAMDFFREMDDARGVGNELGDVDFEPEVSRRPTRAIRVWVY